MSKRVEVREGDRFALWSGDLYHMSGGKLHCIASGGMMLDAPELTGNHIAFQSSEASRISRRIARAVVEESGGEWAEVAEEKKPEAVEVVYLADGVGRVYMAVKGSKDATMLIESCGHRPITIAGVTK